MRKEVKFSVVMKSGQQKMTVAKNQSYRQARCLVAKEKADWRTALVDFDSDRYVINPTNYKWLVVSEVTSKVISAY
jgi:hypothetical protein